MPASNPATNLRPVDSLEVLVLVDNVTDALSTVGPGAVNETASLLKAGMTEMSGEAKCCAHHGLSLVLAVRAGGESRFMLFDAGPEAYTVTRNGARLGVPFGRLDAVALSHGHWDHGGGLVEAVRLIHEANGGRRVPVHLNEGQLVRRANTLPDGGYLPYKDVPKPAELEQAGAMVTVSPDARLLVDGLFYLSGEIPRVTPYEQGYPGHMKRSPDGQSWEPDPWILDERYLAVNVKGKGVVVFSMCSHAGVVNVLTEARAAFAGAPLHALVGGFHLAGPTVEKAIPETIRGLRGFGLARIIPAHCTGWRAFTALSRVCDESVLMPSAVGRTFVF
jgi:7,8-dihydropterin-6-yl-methyl-4-(beta-D-ribofuranosyl)aminobenzene 5'-phosphate synthase